jgi:hypothetical protein
MDITTVAKIDPLNGLPNVDIEHLIVLRNIAGGTAVERHQEFFSSHLCRKKSRP